MTRHQTEDSRADEPTLREMRFEDFDYDETGKEYLYYYAGWVYELFLGDRGYVPPLAGGLGGDIRRTRRRPP
jgi:hypothetical protein